MDSFRFGIPYQWNTRVKKWEAYVHLSYMQPNQKKRFPKRILGYFAKEEDAARAADMGHLQNVSWPD